MSSILALDGKLMLSHGGAAKPFLQVKSFDIAKSGVYTLEGPNGSGKSMFIRFLTGTLPGAIEQEFGSSIRLDGQPVRIASYRDATRQGISSVFQDDDMISSLSVFENILLRHGRSRAAAGFHFAWDAIHSFGLPPMTSAAKLLGPALSARIQSWIGRLEPADIDWMGRKALREQAADLLSDHGVPDSILDELPSRLSGGGRAAAKIVSAQLQANTRVLLLDEAFNGVERLVWPRFLDSLKRWAREHDAVILAITHSNDELQRWDPVVRYDVQDGSLVVAEEIPSGIRRRTLLPIQIAVPVFEVDGAETLATAEIFSSLWLRLAPFSEIIVLADGGADTVKMVGMIERQRPAGKHFKRVDLSVSDYGSVDAIVRRISDVNPRRRACIVLVGASLPRALGYFAGSLTQHFDFSGIIVSPSSFSEAIDTVLSHTVVASIGAAPEAKSLLVSSFFNPEAFLLSLHDADRMSGDDLKFALIPCLRMGMLFDDELFDACRSVLAMAKPSSDDAKRIFHAAIHVFNDVVELGPLSPGIGRIMQFGASHAAVVTEITDGRISGGEALLLGMIIETSITRSDRAGDALIAISHQLGISCPEELYGHAYWDRVESAYANLSQGGDGSILISSARLAEIGHFGVDILRSRLTASAGNQNKSLSRFANMQAEAAISTYPLENLQVAITKIRFALPPRKG